MKIFVQLNNKLINFNRREISERIVPIYFLPILFKTLFFKTILTGIEHCSIKMFSKIDNLLGK